MVFLFSQRAASEKYRQKPFSTAESMATTAIAFLFLCFIGNSVSFPDGAPIDACVKPRPNQPYHGQARPQPLETNPFQVTASGSHYAPGTQITVNIRGSEYFKGFFIQARDVQSDNWIGEWIETTNTKKHPECSAITHADPREKQQATLIWQAPKESAGGQVYFTGTVLKEYSTFWSNIVADFAQ